MATLRRYSPGVDSAFNCEGCFRLRPAIVIEDYSRFGDGQKALCRQCAARALEEHPDLLANAVIDLIIGRGREM